MEWPSLQALGLDLSEKMLARAEALTSDAAITYVRTDMERIGLPDAAFDLAYSSLALHCVEDCAGLLARVTVFFDRGVPDIMGYLRLLGRPVPAHVARAAETFRYNRRVFVAPPWPDIFDQDGERKQTFEEAERTYESMVATYGDLGYETATLPRAPVEERVRFVIGNIGSLDQ